MRFVSPMLFVALAACVDSKSGASGSQQEATTVCAGQLYDGCASNDECDSGLCKLYSNRGVEVCTQTCSATNPCPTQSGVAVVCNNMGFCRPDAANACALP